MHLKILCPWQRWVADMSPFHPPARKSEECDVSQGQQAGILTAATNPVNERILGTFMFILQLLQF